MAANTQTALTYGIDILDRTELVNAINSHLIFFKGESGIYELAPSVSPFLNVMGQLGIKQAYGEEEEYAEKRGSYLQTPIGYVSASGTTAITALAPNQATYTGLKVVSAIDGSTRNNDLKVNDSFVLQDFADPTLMAVGWITAVSDDSGDSQYSWKLFTNAPGFNIDVTSGQRTAIYIPSRQSANGGDFATSSYEKSESRWNSVSTFEDGFEIDDELVLNKQHFANINQALTGLTDAQRRLMRKVDLGCLFASSRVGTTAGNPFSAPGTLVQDASGRYMHPTMSIYQGIQSTANGDLSLGGTRVYKNSVSSATIDDIEVMLAGIARYKSNKGANTKMAFCGQAWMLGMKKIARKLGVYQMSANDDKFGMKWTKLVSDFIDLDVTIHDGLIDTPFNNACFIIDPTQVELRELEPMKSEATAKTKRTQKYDITHRIGVRMRMPETSAISWLN